MTGTGVQCEWLWPVWEPLDLSPNQCRNPKPNVREAWVLMDVHCLLLFVHSVFTLTRVRQDLIPPRLQASQLDGGAPLLLHFVFTFGYAFGGLQVFTRICWMYTSNGIPSISDPSIVVHYQLQNHTILPNISFNIVWFALLHSGTKENGAWFKN